jgi:hypothetical protein
MKAIYDLGAVPVDANAREVLKPGDHYDPTLRPDSQLEWDTPPPAVSRARGRHEVPPEDLTGRKHGNLTVVSYWGRGEGAQRGAVAQKWVCRCLCGRYVIRTGKSIKNQVRQDKADCCRVCNHLSSIQYHDRMKQLKQI